MPAAFGNTPDRGKIMQSQMTRREFMAQAGTIGAVAGSALLGQGAQPAVASPDVPRPVGPEIRIRRVDARFEREPLVRAFGFKGGYLTEIWQTVTLLESAAGNRGIGLGTQNVLWSDAPTFAAHTESGGNALMFALTEFALQRLKGASFGSPIELQEEMLEAVHAYGCRITGNPDLRMTFSLNALVAIDNAAWLLYAAENGIRSFDELIPEEYRPGLSYRHEFVAGVPAIAFSIPLDEVRGEVAAGARILKIKLGMPGSQQEMLEQDARRLSAIHTTVREAEESGATAGRVPYWLDPNGRYESKDRLLRLLDHADSLGALDRIAILEEPFPEALKIDVSDLGLTLAADESAHTDRDVEERLDLGYSAIALKAIAKTLSMTLKMARVAHERGASCVCADLTVNPILVDWNKSVAARLAPLPGFDMGLMETNGHQNYRNWEAMIRFHPKPDAPWIRPHLGRFVCGREFFEQSGGILDPSSHYDALFQPPD